jgi:outer membrane lipoprotein-sorting protein
MSRLKSLLFATLVLGWTASSFAQTVNELIARMITARGGIEKIRAIQTRRETGTISFGPETEGPFTAELARPNKLRVEVTLPNAKVVQAYDGNSGWQITPGADQAFVMDQAQQRSMGGQADFDGPLIDYKRKGNAVEQVGLGELNGRKTYRLRVSLANGDVHYWELDAENYLPVRWRGNRTANGNEVPIESVFTDFRDVNGVQFPFTIESFIEGKLVQQMKITSREANVKIEDARFAMPGQPPATPQIKH